MSSHYYAKNWLLELLKITGQTLSAIGTPVLFAIKILVWTIYWLGNETIKLCQKIVFLFEGLIKTLFWFLSPIVTLAKNFRFPELPEPPQKSLPKIYWPEFSWPKLPLPRFKKPRIKTKIRRLTNWFYINFRFRSVRLPQKMAYLGIGAVLAVFFIFIPVWAKFELDQLPNPELLSARDIPVSTKIYDRNGVLLYQIYSGENRNMIALSDLPKYVPEAAIAIEDKNFYHHWGFDLAGITRAAFANSQGEIVQGGSTITQQLIRSALLSPEKTWSRKIKELILSFWAERLYSKDQILTMYLNQIPYGGAAYGIDAAAQTYFGKHAKDLTLGEAALLAGLTSAPTTYSPFGTRPELSRERQRQVLEDMASQGYINGDQLVAALAQPLNFTPPETAIKAPHFVMYVRDYLTKKYGARTVEQGGLEVTTSLDYGIYEQVTKMISDGVVAQKSLNVGNGAALVTNPATGEILAMVGSVNFFDSAHDGNVNVTLAARSPGSSIKPLNYALAFEKGFITPSTILDDSPVVYRSAGGPDYAPQNYDNRFHGRVSVRTALASSYNIPAVRVLEKNGVGNFIDFAQKMGITTWTDRSRFGLSLTLGGGEVTMMDLATAYSAFATGGKRVDLNPIEKITDYRGKVLEDHLGFNSVPQSTQVISPQTAFLISDILADNSARTPTFGPNSNLVIPGRTVSVKTGTTEDKRDNWTIGYTPSILAAVWVGNNDNSPMGAALESGNSGAAAVWNPIMKYLLAGKPDEGVARPDNIIPIQVCSLNGLLPCENCPTKTEYFIKGTEPKTACNFTKEEVDKILHPPENNKQP
ncbi:PBP1A family penicillin-binding protein [Patescibacteria group bacterium]|nr:PBP1A family penicillin-binding protein [Patescibacteria group bacterium]